MRIAGSDQGELGLIRETTAEDNNWEWQENYIKLKTSVGGDVSR